MRTTLLSICTLVTVLGRAFAQFDGSPHVVRLVTVEPGIKVEVLDWSGSGRPVVFLAGLGDSAHIFDQFAPLLTAEYHVYGITRRGYGASSSPASGYEADRLGDDVLAVIDSLRLSKPVLIGHSIAGQELSSIGSRHPDKVGGLVYLDAGYSYAYYDRVRGDVLIDLLDLQRKLAQLQLSVLGQLQPDARRTPQELTRLIEELLDTDLPRFEQQLREVQAQFAASPTPRRPLPLFPPVALAIIAGRQKYTEIHAPVLAIYALPHEMSAAIANDSVRRAAAEAMDLATTGAQVNAFEKGVASARVVRLPHASHYVFRSHEIEVLREIRAFIASLPAMPQ
jgi:pimeloyl-ACP methyl ester carboxylesterase